MTAEHNTPILACIIDAIPKEQRPLHQATTQRLMALVEETRELPTGYAWRLPNEEHLLQTIAAFITLERLCCPFFHFTLEVEANQGVIWFSITGAIDIKTFLYSEGLVPSATSPYKNS